MNFLSLLFIGLLFLECRKKDEPSPVLSAPLLFDTIPVTTPLAPGIVDEASGIADSKAFPGNIWVQQDGGNSAHLTLLSYSGAVQKKILLKSTFNRDWEDMAIGNGPQPGINYIYIAETGDNNLAFTYYTIYRFEEPTATTDTIRKIDHINFLYPDGPHDAEAIFVDNPTKDIYIITKRDAKSKIYKLPYPQNTATANKAIAVGELPFNGVTGAASSPDGKELIIKTYTTVDYWKVSGNETIETTLQKNSISLGYTLEPQGEAVCFKQDNTGFFTLSEKPVFASSVTLNLYKRK
jgi:hypothetical protein